MIQKFPISENIEILLRPIISNIPDEEIHKNDQRSNFYSTSYMAHGLEYSVTQQYLMLGTYGILLDKDGVAVQDLVPSWHKANDDFKYYERHSEHNVAIHSKRVINGRAVLVSSPTHRNYSHWHLDWITGIAFLDRIGVLNGNELFPIPYDSPSYVLESMKALGVKGSQIDLYGTESLVYDEIVFSGFPYLQSIGRFHPFVRCVFDRIRENMGADSLRSRARMIFVSRGDSNNRKCSNENDVERLFRDIGFECVCLSGMSYTDQVSLFSNAIAVAGLHGAGLTNIGFMDPGGLVIEIATPNWPVATFRRLANICAHRYGVFWAGNLDKIDHAGTFAVNIAELDAFCTKLLLTKSKI